MEQGLQLGQLNDQIIKKKHKGSDYVYCIKLQPSKNGQQTHNGVQYIDIYKIHTITIDKITTLYKSKTSN